MSTEAFERLAADRKGHILAVGIGEFSRSSYADVSTENLTKRCGISKGLLFHYFGSKKAYYLRCLAAAMDRLTEKTEDAPGTGFYEILFDAMEKKMDLCRRYGDEMRMVNMASRDASGEIAREKADLLRGYAAAVQAESARTLKRAVAVLDLKETDRTTAAEGLQIYVGALINRYLLTYQQTPDLFFENSETVRRELKLYLDLMLYGICR